MSKNKVQFQKGMSLLNFMASYGDEFMLMNNNAENLFSRHAGLMVFYALNAAILNVVKLEVVITFNVIAVTIKHLFCRAPFMSQPSFH